jgi:hypothetical protein
MERSGPGCSPRGLHVGSRRLTRRVLESNLDPRTDARSHTRRRQDEEMAGHIRGRAGRGGALRLRGGTGGITD